MIPQSTKVLVWGRQQPSYEPGMTTAGTPEVSSVYDWAAGTYIKAPMRAAPFCSGERLCQGRLHLRRRVLSGHAVCFPILRQKICTSATDSC
jgi:hypothetical protein